MRLAKGNQCYKKHSKNLPGCKRYCWDKCDVESIICFSILQQFLIFCMLSLCFKNNFPFPMHLELLIFGLKSEFYP